MKISEIAKINENSLSAKDDWDFVNYLDTGNITQNQIDEIQCYIVGKDKIPSRAKRKVKNNSIVYSTVRPNQCHYGIIKIQPENFVVSTGFAVIDVDERLADAEYIYAYLTQQTITDKLQSIAEQSTSTYPAIKPSDLGDLEISLPSLVEQKKIASILNSLEYKMQNNREINNNLLQQLSTIFVARFTNNPSLDSMKQVSLSDLCIVITKGTTPTTLGHPFVMQGINFIKAESILDNHSLDKGKFSHIDDETHNLLKRSILQSGDIVFTIAGTLGRFAIVNQNILPANTNQAVAIIRANRKKVLPEYLYSCLIGNWHNDYYTKRIQQAVQANLSLTTIKSLPIPILESNEMSEYIQLISPIIGMLKQIELENEQLSSIRDALLPRLMSGELDISKLNI